HERSLTVCRHVTQHPPHVRSFPTRRSSDLVRKALHEVVLEARARLDRRRSLQRRDVRVRRLLERTRPEHEHEAAVARFTPFDVSDRESTRLNCSHVAISYAVFCLKKKYSNV